MATTNDRLLPVTVARRGRKHGFQNTVFRVQDQYGVGVDDYLLEFYKKHDDQGWVAELFHTHRTALVTLQLTRQQSEETFRFRNR